MSKTWSLVAGMSVATAIMASAAHATNVSASFSLYDYNDQTAITTGGSTEYGYSAPMQVSLSTGIAPATTTESFYAFCIDIAHEITGTAGPLAYETIPLSTDTFGTPGDAILTPAAVVGEIGYLANYGAQLIATHATDLDDQLAAVQDAIWTLEYPASTITPTVSYQVSTMQVAQWVATDVSNADLFALPSTTSITAIVPIENGVTQAFVLAGSVPEPAAWTLMTVGIGALGAVLRHRRRLERVASAH